MRGRVNEGHKLEQMPKRPHSSTEHLIRYLALRFLEPLPALAVGYH
jgi:hypothetical protein